MPKCAVTTSFKNQPASTDKIVSLKKCGSGQFGDVYCAETNSHQQLALKFVELTVKNKSKLIALKNEAEALERCQSHHIPHVIEYKGYKTLKNINPYSLEEAHYRVVATKMATSGDLESILSKRTLTEAELKILGKSLLRAVKYLHHHKIVHRDIKPANIVLDNGEWKLIDFGLSKIDEEPKTPCGTPCFEAPEVSYQRRYDPNVDVWSIGVVLYKAHTGVYPFNSSSVEELRKVKEQFIKGMSGLNFKHGSSEHFINMILFLLRPASIRPSARQALEHPFFN